MNIPDHGVNVMSFVELEKEWFERKFYYPPLDESKLSSIFYFPLFWNMFEKTCCGNNAKMNRHAPQLAQDYADKIEDVVGSVWTHYHNRYIQNSKPTPVFKSFTFRTGYLLHSACKLSRPGH